MSTEGRATPLLSGFGVRMEPLSLEHLPALEKIAFDPEIWKYMVFHIETSAELRTWAENALLFTAEGHTQAWVTVLDSGEVAGSSRFADIDWTHRVCELGWTWLGRPYRGSGVNLRAKYLQLRHGFETLGLRRIALKTHHENLQSQRAMLKLGAQYEGMFRNHMIMPDGSARHSRWYSITREDWPEVKERLLARIANEPLHTPVQ